jgi:hypothetical protein
MKRKSVELLIKAVQLLEPNLKVYSNDFGDLVLQAENKVNWYRATANKMKERIRIKKEKILVINEMLATEEYENNLQRLDLKDRCFDEQLQIDDIEMDIAAKDFYSSMYVFRIKNSEREQKEVSKEAELLMADYVQIAEMTLNDNNLSQTNRAMLHGLLGVIHKGLPTVAARNSVYGELRDALLNCGVTL